MGKKYFFRTSSEKKNRIFRRSIYAIQNIKKGDTFSKKNIKVIRPGYGLDPSFFKYLINRKSPLNIKKEIPLKKIILTKLKI